MWQTDFAKLALLISCFKILFIPAYRSTDFEVHRNWLAITHSLPLNAWYKYVQTDTLNDTLTHQNNHTSLHLNSPILSSKSEWTLDYPPLFALMEFLLSQLAFYADTKMLQVDNLNYASYNTIAFQRLSVVLTDVVFLLALYGFAKFFSQPQPNAKSENVAKDNSKSNAKEIEAPLIIILLFLLNSSLFIVDHIHFQYNGVLFGLLLLSILSIYQKRIIDSALLFSVLLCMKHIFLYIAPIYALFMLRNYCVHFRADGSLDKSLFIKKLILLSFIVLIVIIPSFLPFILMGQTSDLISRLFPFKRGLSHAYWAPNFWASYNTLDKLLQVIFSNNQSQPASMTGGRVQEYSHHVLMSIKPIHTFLLSLLFMLPSFRLAWRQNEGHVSFTKAAILCAFTSFLFGWHVHEKALLLVTIPLTLLSLRSASDAHFFLFIHSICNISIMPLIFTQQEALIKYTLCIFSTIISFFLLISQHKPPQSNNRFNIPFMTSLESLYLIGLLFLEVYTSLVHGLVFQGSLAFMPLLLTSFYSSIGLLYSYIKLTFTYV